MNKNKLNEMMHDAKRNYFSRKLKETGNKIWCWVASKEGIDCDYDLDVGDKKSDY